MSVSRRKFLKIAGVSVLGLSAVPAIDVLWRDELQALEVLPPPKALTAKRWAMVVDTRKIDEGTAKRCIEVCHRIHNVPDIGDPKHEIKWIWTEHYEHAFPGQGHEHIEEGLEHKPFLVFCNHCDNPPCVRVCPTKATFKREDGIVMMDQHRCIGCRFCMAACPFGSRSFNWMDGRPYIKEAEMNREFPTRERGVVEKCNFCAERLAKGLMPACVEVSNGALVFGDIEDPDSDVRKILRSHYTIRRKPYLGTNPQIYYIV